MHKRDNISYDFFSLTMRPSSEVRSYSGALFPTHNKKQWIQVLEIQYPHGRHVWLFQSSWFHTDNNKSIRSIFGLLRN